MKKFTTHPVFFVFIILVLSPMVGVYMIHLHKPIDYEKLHLSQA